MSSGIFILDTQTQNSLHNHSELIVKNMKMSSYALILERERIIMTACMHLLVSNRLTITNDQENTSALQNHQKILKKCFLGTTCMAKL